MGEKNTLRWFGHIERMGSEEFVRKVYVSESVDPNSRGRPLGRWRDRVTEYMCEMGATRGGGLDQARKECLDRERWRLFCRGHTLGGYSWRRQSYGQIDRNISQLIKANFCIIYIKHIEIYMYHYLAMVVVHGTLKYSVRKCI